MLKIIFSAVFLIKNIFYFSRNVPPEFLDGLGSLSASLYPMHRQSVATIVTQPKSVQTISSIQFESKSNASVQALIHPGPNHVHPCCEERRVFPLNSTLVANEPCLETRANHLESDVRLLIKYLQTHDKVFSRFCICTAVHTIP